MNKRNVLITIAIVLGVVALGSIIFSQFFPNQEFADGLAMFCGLIAIFCVAAVLAFAGPAKTENKKTAEEFKCAYCGSKEAIRNKPCPACGGPN